MSIRCHLVIIKSWYQTSLIIVILQWVDDTKVFVSSLILGYCFFLWGLEIKEKTRNEGNNYDKRFPIHFAGICWWFSCSKREIGKAWNNEWRNDRLDGKPYFIFLYSKGKQQGLCSLIKLKNIWSKDQFLFFFFWWNVRKETRFSLWKLFQTISHSSKLQIVREM